MKDSRRIAVGIAAVAAAGVVGFFLLDGNDPTRAKAVSPSALAVQQKAAGESAGRSNVVAPKQWFKSDHPAVSSLPPSAQPDAGRSHLADALNAPNRSGMEDLKVVMNLFAQYRVRFRGFPVAEDNAGFVNALTGQNPSRVALIPRDHPAIDAKGQLLDRWGEPFFFHLLGRDALEIRSAGPDQKLYTADDLLNASAPNQDATLAIKDL